MRLVHVILVVFVQTSDYTIINSQAIGEYESCLLDSGQFGNCVHIENCPGALALIRAGAGGNLRRCGFNGIYPIVCCEDVTVESKSSYGSIAKQKCAEYKITSITTTTTTTTTTTSSPLFPKYGLYAIGGVDAIPLEFPHMAVLGYGSADNIQWRCGGSLISENFVLTAAHCVYTRLGRVQHIKLGVHQLSYYTNYIQTFTVKNIYKHPDYVGSQDYHDIALIELDHPADIQSGVKPACLHTSKQLPSDFLVATGWGATELYGDINDILQKVYLKSVPFNICSKYYDNQRRVVNGLKDDWQLCADGGEERRDTCQGDSGGPLQFKMDSDELFTIIGITSFGIKCALVPGVYTRVSYYVSWIESIVWPEESVANTKFSIYYFGS